MDQNAERGSPTAGPPLRLESGRDDHVAEAEIVAELTGRVIGGESIRALAADLRKRGSAFSGRAWHPGSVKSIVLRPRNAGLREHRGQVVGPAPGPPSWTGSRGRRHTRC